MIVDSEVRAALCDFGLSRFYIDDEQPDSRLAGDQDQKSSSVVAASAVTRIYGTLRYCAPEFVRADDVCPSLAADVYAFGCTSLHVRCD